MTSDNCNPFWKIISSWFNCWIGKKSNSEFIVVYPPLEQAEEIRNHPELFNPLDWRRHERNFNYFHHAWAVAEEENIKAKKVIAIVCGRKI